MSLRHLILVVITLLGGVGSCLAAPITVTPLQGNLELIWGDAAPESADHSSPFLVTLVTEDGQRIALDPPTARRAAGNLYSLQGRQVTVVPAQIVSNSAGSTLLAVDTMIAANSTTNTAIAPNAVIGTQAWVSILCKFSDNTAEPKDLTYFSNMLSNQSGRLDDYWRTVSYGKVNVAGSMAYGWFVLPHPRAFYIPTNGSANLSQLFTDCTAAADSTVNFSLFVGINQMFNDNLDCCAWGGTRYTTLDGKTGSWRVTWEPPWGYQNEAPLAHEMGHGFGLPHANNSDHDTDPYDNPWDVMSDAWHNAVPNATFGAQPKHINVYHRDQLGWIDAARKLTITQPGNYPNLQLDRASLVGSTHLQMIQVSLPGAATTHYYVIEARMKIAASYEANLAGDAVIIHEVDQTRGEPSWSMDADIPPANVSNNEGSMFKVGESWSAPSGAFSLHVDSSTTDGFVLSLTRGADDLLFRNGFQ